MPDSTTLKRRDVLKLGGVAAAGAVTAPVHETSLARKSPPQPLRDVTAPQIDRVVGPPPLPPLGVIVMNRLAFGPRPGEIAAFNALGATDEARLQAWVDQQLNPNAIDDSTCNAKIVAAGLTTLNKSLAQLWADHVVNNTTGGWSVRIQPFTETRTATLLRAIYSRRQLKEVLVDFWHNHFNVYADDGNIAPGFVHYDRDVIRANVLGNFRTMLGAVATSPAMLYYLDNYNNQAAGPNENWAREMLELHTLGAENYLGVMRQTDVPVDGNNAPIGYVDDDVLEATRAFTGWRVADGDWPVTLDTGEFLYYDPWHDRFQKTVLGRYLPASQAAMQDGKDVLDAAAYHPGTARFIARKLCRRLIGDNPPQTIIDAAAAVFVAQQNAPDQLKQVVRTIVLSTEFKAAFAEKVKRPFEWIVSYLRATNANFSFSNDFYWNFEGLGQPLFEHRPPDGFPDIKEKWLGTSTLLQTWRLINACIEGWIDFTSIDLVSQMPGTLRTPNAIVDYWIDRVLGRPLHPIENRVPLVEFIAQGRNPDFDLRPDQIAERLPRMVAMIFMAPDFGWR
ncbi:MAG: DUF1800 domain-containing protein [Chloroflexi bacterium]|nr:DUF1800 domain-containing protein [Chloroflexota bacterium]